MKFALNYIYDIKLSNLKTSPVATRKLINELYIYTSLLQASISGIDCVQGFYTKFISPLLWAYEDQKENNILSMSLCFSGLLNNSSIFRATESIKHKGNKVFLKIK